MSANRTVDQTPELADNRWLLDPTTSTAEFSVPHFWGLVTVKGHFERLDGWLELDDDDHGRLELTIDSASLNTGNAKRDRHLHSADFFDTDHHPEVRFTSIDLTSHSDGRITVNGELEAGGRRLQLHLQATLERAGEELRIEVTTTIDHRNLGMSWSPLGIIRTPSTLTIRAWLRRER